MSAEYDGIYARLLALVADPYAAYAEPTAILEQCLARTQGLTHGRRDPDPLLAAVATLRAEISAVLETRRRMDLQAAKQAARAKQDTGAEGGAKVPVGPPRPGPLPPARMVPEPEGAL